MATALPQATEQPIVRPSRPQSRRIPPRFSPVSSIWHLVPVALLALAIMAAVGIGILFPEYMMAAAMLPVALLAGMVMTVRPEVALVLTVAYIPFESDQFQPLPLPGDLSVSKIMGFLLLGVFFFNILLRRRRFRVLDDSQDVGVALLAAVMLLSGISSQFPARTLDGAERMLRMFAFYLAIKNLATTPGIVRTMMWAFLLTTTYASGWGINEFYENRLTRIHDIRARGVFMDVNDYAALTVVAIAIGLHLLAITKKLPLKALVAFCLGVSFYGLILSGSRGGLLAMAAVLALFIWRHPRRNQLAVIVTLATVLSFPFWPDSIKTRLLGDDDALNASVYSQTTEHSTERRASYLAFGSQIISEYPILGAGYRTFSQLYPRSEFAFFDNPVTDTQRFRLAHNTYLELAVGIGLGGLAVYVGVFLIAIRSLHQVLRQTARGTLLWGAASAFQLALISLMISSFFLSIEHFKITWVSIALSSALLFQLKAEQEQAAQAKQEQPTEHPAPLPVST